MEARPVIVRAADGEPQSWESAVAGATVVELRSSPSAEARSALHLATCALLDGTLPDPVGLARRVHSVESPLQVVIVAPPDTRPRVERAVLFTPGLGEVWIVRPDEVGSALVQRASAVTHQRRSYQATHARLEHDLASIEPHSARRAFVSDAYLAALLGILPDPVLSIGGEEAGILSWNVAAERALGYTREEAIGKPIHEVLAPEHPERLEKLLASEEGAVGREIRLLPRRGEPRVVEISVVPVEAAGHRVRAVILHDVTEERRIQAEREAQAAELEMQAEELQSQASQLQEAQLGLETANEELQRANLLLGERTAEAERQRREAEAANRAKSEFLATMSHELRTPLNAMIGYTDLLLAGIPEPIPEGPRVKVERIGLSARHLLALIEEILTFSRLEAGEEQVEIEPIEPHTLIDEVLALTEPLALSRELELVTRLPENPDPIPSDSRKLRQILVNLVGNAVKFTESGRVSLSLEQRDDRAIFRVSDTGVGIAPTNLERIFEPFWQAEAGRIRTYGGTGLGLSVARRFAKLLGGDLTVTSEVGNGSVFTLSVPMQPPPTPSS